MSKTLFQQEKLTIADDHVKVGETTLYYPSISGVTIFDGKPMRGTGISLLMLTALMVLGGGAMTLVFGRLFGPIFNSKMIWLAFMPTTLLIVAGGIWCLNYDAKVLYLIVGGQQVGVLKSKDRADLERAKAAIELARATAK